MTYLPHSQLIGVIRPEALNYRDIGKNWIDLGGITGLQARGLTNLADGIAILNNGTTVIFRSTDYGSTWTNLGAITVSGINESGAYLGNGIVIIGDTSNNIFRSIDYGVNWTNVQVVNSSIFPVVYCGDGIAFICTTDGHIWRSTDFGATWTHLNGGVAFTTSFLTANYLDNGIAIAINGTDGHVWRSIDYGASWTDLGLVLTALPFPQLYLTSSYLGNGIVIIANDAGHIFRSMDYGITYLDLGAISANALRGSTNIGNGVALVSEQHVGSAIWRSIDFGLTWTSLGNISPTLGFNPEYLGNGVVIFGDGAGHVFRSEVAYKNDEAESLIDPSYISTHIDITLGQSHNTVNVNTGIAGNRIITLPNPNTIQIGHEYTIKKIDATANTVTINTLAGVIDTVFATRVLNMFNQSITLRSDGANYYIV